MAIQGVLVRTGRLRGMAAALLATTAVAGTGFAVPAYAQDAGTQTRTFNIPAGPLASALTAFGDQADLQVTVDTALVEGRQSAGFNGTLAPHQVLSQLLYGTGLTWRSLNARAIKIERAPHAAEGAIQLGPVRVEGTTGPTAGYSGSLSNDPGATEGTGSYTQTGTSSTATALGLSLRETPQSVTVITRQKMNDKGYQTLDQAIVDSPGMTAANELGSTRFMYFSRGLVVDSIQYNGMSTHLNVFTRDADPADDLDIYDRVEILRGAAGLTAGAGNPAGAINLIRKRPLNAPKTTIEASASSFGNGKLLLDTSQPLNSNGSIRGRLVGSFTDGDSYIDYTSRRAGMIYGSIDADIGDRTTVGLGYSYIQEKIDGYDWVGLPVRSDGSFFDFDASTFMGNASDYADRRQHTAYLDFEHRFSNDWILKSAGRASWSDAEMETGTRYYSSGAYTRHSRQFDYDNEVYSLDVKLSGSVDIFGRSHDVTIGFNGARSEITGLTKNPNLTVIYDPENWDPTTEWSSPNYTPSSLSNSVNEQYGFYGQVRINITDSLKAFTGGRISWYQNTDNWYYPRTGSRSSTTLKENARFIPYIGIVYDITGHTSAYASYTSIFTPQSSSYGIDGPLSPVIGSNVELGIKHELFDGGFIGSVAVFETKRDNVADIISGLITCGPLGISTCYEGVDGIRTRGFEFEIAGKITDRWRITGGYTYSTSEYTEGSLSGQKFATNKYPEQILKLFTTYTLPDERLTVGGGVRAQSKIYYSSSTVNIEQTAYAVVDLTANYRFGESTVLQLNINNLLDKTYYSTISENIANSQRIGSPQEFRIVLRHEF